MPTWITVWRVVFVSIWVSIGYTALDNRISDFQESSEKRQYIANRTCKERECECWEYLCVGEPWLELLAKRCAAAPAAPAAQTFMGVRKSNFPVRSLK